jgi:hypothetical protein
LLKATAMCLYPTLKHVECCVYLCALPDYRRFQFGVERDWVVLNLNRNNKLAFNLQYFRPQKDISRLMTTVLLHDFDKQQL